MILELAGVLFLALSFSLNTALPEGQKVIHLPRGWEGEGIENGRGSEFFAASLRDGSVYKGDFETGEGQVLVDNRGDESGIPVAGLAYDPIGNVLLTCGTRGKTIAAHDGSNGELLQEWVIDETENDFINDAVITSNGTYFTLTLSPNFIRLNYDAGGLLPDVAEYSVVPLTGDMADDFEEGAFNSNGIEVTADGDLIIVSQGLLYLVDPEEGSSIRIDLGPDVVLEGGDGLAFTSDNSKLLCAGNFSGVLYAVALANDNLSGTVTSATSPLLRIGTTVVEYNDLAYIVNARFDLRSEAAQLAYEVIELEVPE